MQDKGYDITGLKCSTKFQSLKRAYKIIVDYNNKNGNNPKKWEYFQIMQELFADKPWVQPMAVAGSHINTIEEEKGDDLPEKSKIKCILYTYFTYTC
ncbi:hypothetical protein EAI_06022 [Harpegnathos saltator]|uniref:Myb/SANT-like DNA-binding domain-containing protein n=1 Tax=Harpegnathos saltator TaxID=610380 RepID=E2C6D2_HARSA|nr:hypothetical protein EAI_06022 [Harpegnathos saltator]